MIGTHLVVIILAVAASLVAAVVLALVFLVALFDAEERT